MLAIEETSRVFIQQCQCEYIWAQLSVNGSILITRFFLVGAFKQVIESFQVSAALHLVGSSVRE